MNKSDKVQFERELVRVSHTLDAAMRDNKPKTEARTREELHQLMRHI